MKELFNFIYNFFCTSPLLGAICLVSLMWGIAFMLVPILQIVEYHSDCKKYGKDRAYEIHRRM